jgi:hypothetical protein
MQYGPISSKSLIIKSEIYAEYEKVSEFYKESGALNPYKDEHKQNRAVFFGVI